MFAVVCFELVALFLFYYCGNSLNTEVFCLWGFLGEGGAKFSFYISSSYS